MFIVLLVSLSFPGLDILFLFTAYMITPLRPVMHVFYLKSFGGDKEKGHVLGGITIDSYFFSFVAN